MMDAGNLSLRAKHPQTQQGCSADAIATIEGIDRAAADQLAVTSQERAAKAIAEGRFDGSIVPVRDPETGELVLDKEEFPRPGTTLDSLSTLNTVFDKFMEFPIDDKGTTYGDMIYARYPELKGKMQHIHHAGNSSGVVDGAAALLLASEGYVKKTGMKPRARIVATANIGDDPTLMLNAPVPAARKVLEKAGLTTDDIDVYEINEAFAAIVLALTRELGLAEDIVNVEGGAIAHGHPIGATGAVLTTRLLHAMARDGVRRGVVTLCIGGGQGVALALERLA